MELKLAKTNISISKIRESSNRTFMELKWVPTIIKRVKY